MKRADALTHIRIAGFHGDKKAFTRLYVENRVSYPAAQEAYRQGIRQKEAGVRCDCFECKKEAQNGTGK